MGTQAAELFVARTGQENNYFSKKICIQCQNDIVAQSMLCPEFPNKRSKINYIYRYHIGTLIIPSHHPTRITLESRAWSLDTSCRICPIQYGRAYTVHVRYHDTLGYWRFPEGTCLTLPPHVPLSVTCRCR